MRERMHAQQLQIQELSDSLSQKLDTINTLQGLSADQASEIQIWKENYDKLEKQFKSLQSQTSTKYSEYESAIKVLNEQLSEQIALNK